MGSGITLKSVDPVDIPTPDANKSTIFIDSTNADEPSYKDDAGAVHTLVGAAGATGATGPAGPPVLIDGEAGEDGLTIPGPAGASGSGGGGTSSDIYANIPSPTTDGELFLPTDGISIYRADGAAWSPWGPIYPLVTPINGDYSWVNQETASVAASAGGIYLSDVAGGAVVNDIRARVKSAPSTPYTITACFLVDWRLNLAFHQFGLCFRESGTGELQTVGYFTNGTTWVQASRTFDAPDGTATDLFNLNVGGLSTPVWLRIEDDGVNRISYFSIDGQNFIQFHSMGRTTTLTADQVGFFINVVNTSVGMAINLISWKEE